MRAVGHQLRKSTMVSFQTPGAYYGERSNYYNCDRSQKFVKMQNAVYAEVIHGLSI